MADFLRLQLVPQTNSNWFAVVVDTDRPEQWTTPLRDVVQSADVGDRAIVSNHTATRYSGNESYRLTDQAIAECPSQCRWLMCTNADNRYHPEALSIVDHEFDVVSMDFFSRWWTAHVPTLRASNSCRHFPAHFAAILNAMKSGATDLGSMIFSLDRWRRDGRSWSAFNREPDHAEQDGDLAASVIADGWRWKAVRRTLLSHSPNEWECAVQHNNILTDDVVQRLGRCHMVAERMRELRESPRAPTAVFSSFDAHWRPTNISCFDFQ